MKKHLSRSYIIVLFILFQSCSEKANTKKKLADSTNSEIQTLNQSEGLKAIYRYTLVENSMSSSNFDLINGGLNGSVGPIYRETSIALFEDGTYTGNIDDIIQKGIKPKAKGKWRFKNKKLQLSKNNGEFKTARSSYRVKAGSINQKLNGCFMQILGSQNKYPDVDKYICFDPKGNYKTIGKVPLYKANIHEGQYRIDGYVIEFRDLNGKKERRMFSFLLDNKKDIEVSDTRYSLSNKKMSDFSHYQMTNKEKHEGEDLVIVNHVSNRENGCEPVKNFLEKKGWKVISIEEKNQRVSCKDFGLEEDGKKCRVIDYTGKYTGTKACIAWFKRE